MHHNGYRLWSVSMAHKAIVSGSPVRGLPGTKPVSISEKPEGIF